MNKYSYKRKNIIGYEYYIIRYLSHIENKNNCQIIYYYYKKLLNLHKEKLSVLFLNKWRSMGGFPRADIWTNNWISYYCYCF